jgi:hypothetical protein
MGSTSKINLKLFALLFPSSLLLGTVEHLLTNLKWPPRRVAVR